MCRLGLTVWMSLHLANRGLTCPCRDPRMLWPPGFCLAIPAVTAGPAVHSPGPLAPSSLLTPSRVLSVFHWLSPCFPASLYLAISGWLAISVSHLPSCCSLSVSF